MGEGKAAEQDQGKPQERVQGPSRGPSGEPSVASGWRPLHRGSAETGSSGTRSPCRCTDPAPDVEGTRQGPRPDEGGSCRRTRPRPRPPSKEPIVATTIKTRALHTRSDRSRDTEVTLTMTSARFVSDGSRSSATRLVLLQSFTRRRATSAYAEPLRPPRRSGSTPPTRTTRHVATDGGVDATDVDDPQLADQASLA